MNIDIDMAAMADKAVGAAEHLSALVRGGDRV
jgi:hypothetical protein